MVDIDSIMPRRIEFDEFDLESVGRVSVSTIELQVSYSCTKPRYETCIFWPAVKGSVEENWYIAHCGYDEDEAVLVHESWCDPAKLGALVYRQKKVMQN